MPMKRMGKLKAGQISGLGLMIGSIIVMFMYMMLLQLPTEHLGFLTILMPLVPFMAPIALLMGLIGFFIMLISSIMMAVKKV